MGYCVSGYGWLYGVVFDCGLCFWVLWQAMRSYELEMRSDEEQTMLATHETHETCASGGRSSAWPCPTLSSKQNKNENENKNEYLFGKNVSQSKSRSKGQEG